MKTQQTDDTCPKCGSTACTHAWELDTQSPRGIWDERTKTFIKPAGTVKQGRRPMFKPFDTPRTSHSPLTWRSGPAGDELSSVLNVPKGTMLIAAKRSNGSWDHVASLAQSAEPEANAAFIVRACSNAQRLADAVSSFLDNARLSPTRANTYVVSEAEILRAGQALAQWEGSK